jgi:vacuolar-type H+-ATPase subunit D/Vma8
LSLRTQAIAKPNTTIQTRVRLWNIDEYHRMLETGIIAADERVELIEGQVIPMSSKIPHTQPQPYVHPIVSSRC